MKKTIAFISMLMVSCCLVKLHLRLNRVVLDRNAVTCSYRLKVTPIGMPMPGYIEVIRPDGSKIYLQVDDRSQVMLTYTRKSMRGIWILADGYSIDWNGKCRWSNWKGELGSENLP